LPTIIRTVELGVRITDAALLGETTVLWCELLVEGPGRCPGCGVAGTYRDSIERRVSDVPVVGHPLQLRVRVPRYRCRHNGCAREVFVADTSRLARAGSTTTVARATPWIASNNAASSPVRMNEAMFPTAAISRDTDSA
jgi:transposase